jgi:hypothetical protein
VSVLLWAGLPISAALRYFHSGAWWLAQNSDDYLQWPSFSWLPLGNYLSGDFWSVPVFHLC